MSTWTSPAVVQIPTIGALEPLTDGGPAQQFDPTLERVPVRADKSPPHHRSNVEQPVTPAPSTMGPSGRASRPVRLSAERLHALDDQLVLPQYKRSAVSPSVVHIGVGGFHRAHQAVYFDDIASKNISMDWGITGVGLHNPAMGAALSQQDNLYTVLVRSEDADEARVIGIIQRYLFAPQCPSEFLSVLTDEETRLVTLTITGSGYPATGTVDPDDPDVRADLDNPASPRTVWGYLVEGLRRRRTRGLPPFTILSCDNIPANGDVVRRAIVSTAELRDPELAKWIDQNGAFPSSMVDRITPETTDQTRTLLAHRYHVEDAWPVVTEPFSQWIVQDQFCNGRPPLDQVGVRFVDDVLPYEMMKARLLNGAHSALGYLGCLAGFQSTDGALTDAAIRDYVAGYLREASALLPGVPGVNLDRYCSTLLQRFANPRIGDQLSRLCRRGSTKVPSYVLPSLRDALKHDRPRAHLVLAVAAWLRYLRGTDCAGNPLKVDDVRADELRTLALTGETDPRSVLGAPDLFDTLAADTRLVSELQQALKLLEKGPLSAARTVSAASLSQRRAAA